MGGRVWLESEVGRGSTFHFTVSFVRGRGATAAPPAISSAALRGLRVLVVDDNATNRFILEEVLGNWEMLATAADGSRAALAALERAGRAGEPFALVLIDGHMPGMDGFALAARIRQDPGLSGTTLVMLTSGGQAGEVARCRELGIGSYLMKPIKQTELLRAIGSALHLIRRGEPKPVVAVPRDTRSLRVLLAEDNLVNQRLAVRLLEKAGHTATVADNGKQALAALERERFDLVLMDVEMPEMGGLEATAAVRAREKITGRHVPIIAMTAHAMTGDRDRCLAAGMDGYVAKPVQAQELCRMIDELVLPGAAAEKAAGASLDREAALESVGGDEGLLREIIGLFSTQSAQWMADIRDAVERGDAVQLRRVAHKFKGAVGHFGAGPVYGAAQRLETMGLHGDLTGAAAAREELEEQLHRLLQSLTAFSAREPS
jgi:CheY-like chemotaxis protein